LQELEKNYSNLNNNFTKVSGELDSYQNTITIPVVYDAPINNHDGILEDLTKFGKKYFIRFELLAAFKQGTKFGLYFIYSATDRWEEYIDKERADAAIKAGEKPSDIKYTWLRSGKNPDVFPAVPFQPISYQFLYYDGHLVDLDINKKTATQLFEAVRAKLR